MKICGFGLQPVLLICLHLFGTPEQREKVSGEQKLPGPSSAVWGQCSLGLTLAAVVWCERWFPSAHTDGFLAVTHQLLTFHPNYLFLSFSECQHFYKCRLGLGERWSWIWEWAFEHSRRRLWQSLWGLACLWGIWAPNTYRKADNQYVRYNRGVPELAVFHSVIITSGVNLMGFRSPV